MAWKKFVFLKDRVGQEFDAWVTAVVGFGLFVTLDEIYVDGLVPISSLEDDFYRYDDVGHQLVGAQFGRVYRLGDRLRVKLVRADSERRALDFRPVRRLGRAAAGRAGSTRSRPTPPDAPERAAARGADERARLRAGVPRRPRRAAERREERALQPPRGLPPGARPRPPRHDARRARNAGEDVGRARVRPRRHGRTGPRRRRRLRRLDQRAGPRRRWPTRTSSSWSSTARPGSCRRTGGSRRGSTPSASPSSPSGTRWTRAPRPRPPPRRTSSASATSSRSRPFTARGRTSSTP